MIRYTYSVPDLGPIRNADVIDVFVGDTTATDRDRETAAATEAVHAALARLARAQRAEEAARQLSGVDAGIAYTLTSLGRDDGSDDTRPYTVRPAGDEYQQFEGRRAETYRHVSTGRWFLRLFHRDWSTYRVHPSLSGEGLECLEAREAAIRWVTRGEHPDSGPST